MDSAVCRSSWVCPGLGYYKWGRGGLVACDKSCDSNSLTSNRVPVTEVHIFGHGCLTKGVGTRKWILTWSAKRNLWSPTSLCGTCKELACHTNDNGNWWLNFRLVWVAILEPFQLQDSTSRFVQFLGFNDYCTNEEERVKFRFCGMNIAILMCWESRIKWLWNERIVMVAKYLLCLCLPNVIFKIDEFFGQRSKMMEKE